MLVSNCCGSPGCKEWFGSGMPYRDFDVCDKCEGNCEYVEDYKMDLDDIPDDLYSQLNTLDKITQKIKP